MKRILYFIFPLLLFLVVTGCGSGKSDGGKKTTNTNLVISKVSPEVGIVLNLLTGQTTQQVEEGTQLQKIKRQAVTYTFLQKPVRIPLVPIDGPCQYEGLEKYTPEALNLNSYRETFIYDKCKKDNPIASHIIEYFDGQRVIDRTDPDYQGGDPLGDPYFIEQDKIMRMVKFTSEEYDSATGVLLTTSYRPEYYIRDSWEYGNEPVQSPGISAYNKSKENMWISGSSYSTVTRGTPNDPSDDSVFENVYKDYHSEEFFSDYYYNPNTGSGGARRQDSTENGYAKVAWEDRKTGRKFFSAASYEDFTTKRYRSRPSEKDDALTYSIDGAITPDSCSGKKYVLKTILSLYKPAGSVCPVDGEIVVTGDDREVTLRFLDNQTVEVDINSDGVVDDTVSCQAVMDSDFCM